MARQTISWAQDFDMHREMIFHHLMHDHLTGHGIIDAATDEYQGLAVEAAALAAVALKARAQKEGASSWVVPDYWTIYHSFSLASATLAMAACCKKEGLDSFKVIENYVEAVAESKPPEFSSALAPFLAMTFGRKKITGDALLHRAQALARTDPTSVSAAIESLKAFLLRHVEKIAFEKKPLAHELAEDVTYDQVGHSEFPSFNVFFSFFRDPKHHDRLIRRNKAVDGLAHKLESVFGKKRVELNIRDLDDNVVMDGITIKGDPQELLALTRIPARDGDAKQRG